MNELETRLGKVLGIGVALSTIALVLGLIATLALGDGVWATRLLTLGVLILIGTPVARVVVSSIAYTRQRNWTFAILALVVLGELIASILSVAGGR